MSDPAKDGYECHGPMTHVELPGVAEGTSAYLCDTCGVWRHKFSPGDVRRLKVEVLMPMIIDAHITASIAGME